MNLRKIYLHVIISFHWELLWSWSESDKSWPYTLSKGYCVITHPVEWWGTVQKADENPDIRRNATCEKQHIIQQQSSYSYLDNKDKANTVFGLNHIILELIDGMINLGKINILFGVMQVSQRMPLEGCMKLIC